VLLSFLLDAAYLPHNRPPARLHQPLQPCILHKLTHYLTKTSNSCTANYSCLAAGQLRKSLLQHPASCPHKKLLKVPYHCTQLPRAPLPLCCRAQDMLCLASGTCAVLLCVSNNQLRTRASTTTQQSHATAATSIYKPLTATRPSLLQRSCVSCSNAVHFDSN
jgi:hypothetical protein